MDTTHRSPNSHFAINIYIKVLRNFVAGYSNKIKLCLFLVSVRGSVDVGMVFQHCHLLNEIQSIEDGFHQVQEQWCEMMTHYFFIRNSTYFNTPISLCHSLITEVSSSYSLKSLPFSIRTDGRCHSQNVWPVRQSWLAKLLQMKMLNDSLTYVIYLFPWLFCIWIDLSMNQGKLILVAWKNTTNI